MKRIRLTLIPLALTVASMQLMMSSVSAQPSETGEDGFVSLFNGQNLDGWDGDPRFWSVVDGAIRGRTTGDNPTDHNTFLVWRGGQLKDFELRIKFRIEGENNSGIQYRSREFDQWRIAGYQAEIINKPDVVGFLWNEQGKRKGVQVGQFVVYHPGNEREVVGEIADRKALRESGHYRPREWNECHIIARGNHVIHRINGRQTVEFIDEDPEKAAREGLLALQVHGGKPLLVEFKDIRLRQFTNSFGDAKVLFDGHSIDQWKVVPDEAQESWSVLWADRRPNIVLIVADDLGYSDIGCYGGEIRTPNLDRLAAGGLKYTQFYNAAKCHTTRASLMSGLYPHRTGCELPLAARATRDSSQRLRHSGVSIGSVLHDAGYATFATGKWHAGGRPLDRGFDRFFGLPGGACSYFTPAKVLQRNGERAQFAPEEEFYFTDAITDEAVTYLTQHFDSNQANPFFLYVAYTAPHWPMQAHEEDIARYKGRYDDGWHAIREQRYRRLIEMDMISANWQLPEMEPSLDWDSAEHHDWRECRMEVYAAMVDRMDQGIGRILQAMESHGAVDNTIVFFLSDNGGSQEEVQADTGYLLGVMPDATRDGSRIHGGNDPSFMPGPETTFQTVGHEWGNVNNTPFRYGKVRVHEGGIASPLIVHWPAGIQDRGSLRRQMTHIIDLLPTCMELAGARYPDKYNGNKTEGLQGLSLVPTFKDRPLDRDTIYFEMNGNRADPHREMEGRRQGRTRPRLAVSR